jgi:hypothetical protein
MTDAQRIQAPSQSWVVWLLGSGGLLAIVGLIAGRAGIIVVGRT